MIVIKIHHVVMIHFCSYSGACVSSNFRLNLRFINVDEFNEFYGHEMKKKQSWNLRRHDKKSVSEINHEMSLSYDGTGSLARSVGNADTIISIRSVNATTLSLLAIQISGSRDAKNPVTIERQILLAF